MSIEKRLFEMTRMCSICRKLKPVRGGTTYPRFKCAGCKKPKEVKNALDK